MKQNDYEILKSAENLQKRAVVDYTEGIVSTDSQELNTLFTSVLNENITILSNLRNYETAQKNNRTKIPASAKEIRAVLAEFNR